MVMKLDYICQNMSVIVLLCVLRFDFHEQKFTHIVKMRVLSKSKAIKAAILLLKGQINFDFSFRPILKSKSNSNLLY